MATEAEAEAVGLPYVPVNVLLKIFGYLDATTLCRASTVCSDWYQLTADDILWRKMMEKHVKTWGVIDNVTLPDLYINANCLTPKQIYLKCCPNLPKTQDPGSKLQALRSLLTATVRSLLWRNTPFLALCGPGLESGTSGIVRKLLYEKNDTFTQTGMFPGRYHGVGSGFSLKFGNRTFNLTTLYSTGERERKSQSSRDRLRRSRMLLHRGDATVRQPGRPPLGRPIDNDVVEEEADAVDRVRYELADETRVLSAALNAVIYVVESTLAPASQESDAADTLAQNRAEISAIDAALPPTSALFVVSCTPSAGDRRLACIDVTRALNLSSLSRPWRVNNCSVDNITSDIKGPIGWLLDTISSGAK